MKKLLIISSIIISLLVSIKKTNHNEIIIPNDSIRIRIICSTNNEIDYNQKLQLKKIVEEELYPLISTSKTKEEADTIIVNNIDKIKDIINQKTNIKNYDIEYGKNYFPEKIYKGVIYNSGYYDSLVITINEGKGSNWWCVLFPPLCLLEQNDTTTDVEYKLYISRIIDNYK